MNRIKDHHVDETTLINFDTNDSIIHNHVPTKFNIPSTSAFSSALHRYGWKRVSKYMEDNFNDKANNIIIDQSIETTFGWKSTDLFNTNIIPYKKPWIGFAHGLLKLPSWYDNVNQPETYVKTKIFIDSLLFCKGIYVLSLNTPEISSLLNVTKRLLFPIRYVLDIESS